MSDTASTPPPVNTPGAVLDLHRKLTSPPPPVKAAEPPTPDLGTVHNQVQAILKQAGHIYYHVRGVQSYPNRRHEDEQEAKFFLQIYDQLTEYGSVATELKRYLPVLSKAASVEFANRCAHAVGLRFALDIFNEMRTAAAMGPPTRLLELVHSFLGKLPPTSLDAIAEACEAEYHRAQYLLSQAEALELAQRPATPASPPPPSLPAPALSTNAKMSEAVPARHWEGMALAIVSENPTFGFTEVYQEMVKAGYTKRRGNLYNMKALKQFLEANGNYSPQSCSRPRTRGTKDRAGNLEAFAEDED